MLPTVGYSLNLCFFPDLTQGKAVINKEEMYEDLYNKEIYEFIYDEDIYEAIYDKEIYEAIYVQHPVDDNDATLEEGRDKWGNVRVCTIFCHIDNNFVI